MRPDTSRCSVSVYCRVSTEEQADKGYSLDTQEQLCREFATRSGYAVRGVYRDEGRSGTTLDRPALQELLAACSRGRQIEAVIVQETDRLARNTHDHLTIRALLQKAGVKLISVAQPMLDDSPEGKMIDTILASVNQFQSDINSRKTRKALQEKFNQGWWPGWAPLGYVNVTQEGAAEAQRLRKTVAQDPESWALLREGFHLFLNGNYAADQLRELLHAKGLRSKTGKKIPHSVMVHILRNPFYAGFMVWKGQRKIGRHAPMISLAEHQKILGIIEAHNQHASRVRRHRFLLRGFAFCGICGHRYTAEIHPAKRKSYYRCCAKGSHSNANQNVEVSDLERQVDQQFKAIQFSQDFVDRIVAHLRRLHAEHKQDIQARKQVLLNQQKALESKRELAEEKLLAGVLSDRAFVRLRDRLEESIAQIRDQVRDLDRHNTSDVEVIRQVLALASNIYDAYRKAPEALQRQYLGLFWDRFVVKDREIVRAIPNELIRALQKEEAVLTDPNWLPSPPLIRTLSDKQYLAELAAKVGVIATFEKRVVTTLVA